MKPSRQALETLAWSAACALVAAAAAYVVIASLPKRFRAGAGVVIVSPGGPVATWTQEAALRRRALLALVRDPEIADRVLARFQENLPIELRTTDALLAAIAADGAAGELLMIYATTDNPTLSVHLAIAWAEAFVEKTNAAGAFSAEAEVLRAVQARTDEAYARYRAAEAAVRLHEASSMAVEIRAKRDRAQSLLSRIAHGRAEVVRDVWTALQRERMARVERAARGSDLPPSEEKGLLTEIRGILANLGVTKTSSRGAVLPVSRPRWSAGAAFSGGFMSLKEADDDLVALERADAKGWETVCARMSNEVVALSARLATIEAERDRLVEARQAAAREHELFANRYLELRVAETSRPPVVRFTLPAAPPANPEGPDPVSVSLSAAAIGALAAVLLVRRASPETAPTPRLFNVLP